MYALQFNPQCARLNLVNIPIPDPEGHEVLIKVCYAGISSADMLAVNGCGGAKLGKKPVILGNEVSGIVARVGDQVCHFSEGDRVAVNPSCGCNHCSHCKQGHFNLCEASDSNQNGENFKRGGWAQYCLVPENQVVLLPESISMEQASMADALSCVCHGYDKLEPLQLGKNILVQGAGIMGQMWASILHFHGHRNVTITEPQENRRKIMKKSETKFKCMDPEELAQFRNCKCTKLSGFDAIIDTSGNSRAIETGYDMLSPGGKLLIFKVVPPDCCISIAPHAIFKKELSILGSLGNNFGFPDALNLMQAMGDKYFDPEKLGVKSFTLCRYNSAFDEVSKGCATKAVFEIA